MTKYYESAKMNQNWIKVASFIMWEIIHNSRQSFLPLCVNIRTRILKDAQKNVKTGKHKRKIIIYKSLLLICCERVFRVRYSRFLSYLFRSTKMCINFGMFHCSVCKNLYILYVVYFKRACAQDIAKITEQSMNEFALLYNRWPRTWQ